MKKYDIFSAGFYKPFGPKWVSSNVYWWKISKKSQGYSDSSYKDLWSPVQLLIYDSFDLKKSGYKKEIFSRFIWDTVRQEETAGCWENFFDPKS